MRSWIYLGLSIALLGGCSPSSVADIPKNSPDSAVSSKVQGHADDAQTSIRPQISKTIRLTTFPVFNDVAHELGLDFTYDNGVSEKVLMVESTGGGAGWLDYDSDGLLDLYFCQGGNPIAAPGALRPLDQLFRQVQSGQFESVTSSAMVVEQGYSQGVAVADFDDDGFDDVYVTNYGPNTLFRNQGDGTFQDVSLTAGVADPLWSTSAAWGDLDGDGDLDLYVCNYVQYDVLPLYAY
jgi:hypothetical protein